MKSWNEFVCDQPELAGEGKRMFLQTREYVGLAFLATLRKDGAPRLHPVSVVFSQEGLFVFIPGSSPKCADLLRDGRYALQAFPPTQNEAGMEFCLSGAAQCIQSLARREAIIAETGVHVAEHEVCFELLLDRAMFTSLVDRDTPNEHAEHSIWRAADEYHAADAFFKQPTP